VGEDVLLLVWRPLLAFLVATTLAVLPGLCGALSPHPLY
jgi:hypothetical protein